MSDKNSAVKTSLVQEVVDMPEQQEAGPSGSSSQAEETVDMSEQQEVGPSDSKSPAQEAVDMPQQQEAGPSGSKSPSSSSTVQPIPAASEAESASECESSGPRNYCDDNNTRSASIQFSKGYHDAHLGPRRPYDIHDKSRRTMEYYDGYRAGLESMTANEKLKLYGSEEAHDQTSSRFRSLSPPRGRTGKDKGKGKALEASEDEMSTTSVTYPRWIYYGPTDAEEGELWCRVQSRDRTKNGESSNNRASFTADSNQSVRSYVCRRPMSRFHGSGARTTPIDIFRTASPSQASYVRTSSPIGSWEGRLCDRCLLDSTESVSGASSETSTIGTSSPRRRRNEHDDGCPNSSNVTHKCHDCGGPIETLTEQEIEEEAMRREEAEIFAAGCDCMPIRHLRQHRAKLLAQQKNKNPEFCDYWERNEGGQRQIEAARMANTHWCLPRHDSDEQRLRDDVKMLKEVAEIKARGCWCLPILERRLRRGFGEDITRREELAYACMGASTVDMAIRLEQERRSQEERTRMAEMSNLTSPHRCSRESIQGPFKQGDIGRAAADGAEPASTYCNICDGHHPAPKIPITESLPEAASTHCNICDGNHPAPKIPITESLPEAASTHCNICDGNHPAPKIPITDSLPEADSHSTGGMSQNAFPGPQTCSHQPSRMLHSAYRGPPPRAYPIDLYNDLNHNSPSGPTSAVLPGSRSSRHGPMLSQPPPRRIPIPIYPQAPTGAQIYGPEPDFAAHGMPLPYGVYHGQRLGNMWASQVPPGHFGGLPAFSNQRHVGYTHWGQDMILPASDFGYAEYEALMNGAGYGLPGGSMAGGGMSGGGMY